jgi:hypothetical protein
MRRGTMSSTTRQDYLIGILAASPVPETGAEESWCDRCQSSERSTRV